MQTAQEQRDASIISAVASGMSRQNPACWNVSIYAHHKHNVKAGFLAGEWGNCLLEAGSRYWQASAQLVWQIQSSVQMRGHCSRAHQRQFRASRASLLLRRFWFLLLVRCEKSWFAISLAQFLDDSYYRFAHLSQSLIPGISEVIDFLSRRGHRGFAKAADKLERQKICRKDWLQNRRMYVTVEQFDELVDRISGVMKCSESLEA